MAEIKAYPLNLEEYINAETVMLWHYGRTSGVFGADNNLAVASMNNSMSLTVSDGVAWMTDDGNHSIVFCNSTEEETGTKETLTISTADGVLNRIDRVIIRWYLPQFSTKPTLQILKGTPSSSPTPPSLTNNSTYREISLAQITVPAGVTSLTAANITDERLDPDVCGIVTSDVEIPTETIKNQATTILNNLNNNVETTLTELDTTVEQTLTELDTTVVQTLSDLNNTVDTKLSEITTNADDLINQIETNLDQVLAGGLPDNIVTNSKIADNAITANKINGLIASIAELNYTDGVTSNIQTQLNTKATLKNFTATLTASKWDGSAAPYTQTVTVTEILTTDNPVIDVVLSTTTSTALNQLEAWGNVSKIVTGTDSITATCLEDKPEVDIPIQIKVVR